VSRKLNEKFLKRYLELDKLCCEKFGVAVNGVTEYINRLNNAKFAAKRDVVLPKLAKYRNLRNRFAHEPQAIRKCKDIKNKDIKWVVNFKKSVKGKKDPISKYLKKARRFVRGKKLRNLIIALLILGVAAVAGLKVAGIF
jgi:hypothetical protein